MLLNKILSSSFRVFSDDLFEGGHDAGEQFGLLSAFGEHAPHAPGRVLFRYCRGVVLALLGRLSDGVDTITVPADT